MTKLDAGPVNEELFARYAVEWHEYHNISQNRRLAQLWTLRKFAIRLGPERTMLDVTSADIREWLSLRVADGFSPGTVRLHLNFFRPFYTWAHGVGLIDGNHLLDIRSVKAPRGTNPRGTPRPYSAAERERFWQDFDATYPWTRDCGSRERGAMFFERYLAGRSRWGKTRAYCKRLQAEAIVALAIYGALRRSEIYNLDLEDMDPDNEYVVVHSARKGRDGRERDRAVPWISEAMRQAVEDWLTARARLEEHAGGFEHDRPWLWLGQREPWLWRPMPFEQRRGFAYLISQCGGKWGFHRLRHTAATEMLRAGMPLLTLRDILGHASVEQTECYVKLMTQDLVHQVRLAQGRFDRAMRREAA